MGGEGGRGKGRGSFLGEENVKRKKNQVFGEWKSLLEKKNKEVEKRNE